ncbi:stonustoxin subunit beta-like, partial [Plectropomus leopardus]|uniref:stonustoxin subunit beta-like n=1 Tax=Plectropomus leopardus TaxID=160734 RepID=UPI001C4B1BCE
RKCETLIVYSYASCITTLICCVTVTPDARKLKLDPNTANRKLILSDNNRKVTVTKEMQPYPDDPERFNYWKQLLCTHGLTGRCYWEVEWEGHVYVAVTYKGIKRRGDSDDCCLGMNNRSWSLSCSGEGYSGLHSNRSESISLSPSNRVGVYLDWCAGTLSFYRISNDKLTHILTFNTKFTEPVYPAFRVKMDPLNSSFSLC